MSLDSEDPLLEVVYGAHNTCVTVTKPFELHYVCEQELLDDVNALEQSHDQMQTSYRSNQVQNCILRSDGVSIYEHEVVVEVEDLVTNALPYPQEDEEDYFAQARKGRDRVSVSLRDSFH